MKNSSNFVYNPSTHCGTPFILTIFFTKFRKKYICNEKNCQTLLVRIYLESEIKNRLTVLFGCCSPSCLIGVMSETSISELLFSDFCDCFSQPDMVEIGFDSRSSGSVRLSARRLSYFSYMLLN